MGRPTSKFPSLQTKFTPAPVYTIGVLGDSVSNNFTLGVPLSRMWPERLANMLRQVGCFVKVRNYGRSGNTTQNTVPNGMYRFPATIFAREIPDLFVVDLGRNDPGASLTTAQTTANLQAITKGAKFGCKGFVAGQANLPAGGFEGDRYVVLADTSTTGGVAALKTWQLSKISGDYSGGAQQTVWEYRTGLAGETGWGRVATAATAPTHCQRIIIKGCQYLNYSNAFTDGSGRDTLATPYTLYNATNGVRKAQIDAAANENTGAAAGTVIYGDMYTRFAALISAGTIAAGSFSWHPADGNQHLNDQGESYEGGFMFDLMNTQDWVDPLRPDRV